jgi:hypothetical protein
MSSILYYSNYCENCKQLLQKVSKSNAASKIHFICIDKRVKKSNGATYIILENGQELILPPTIARVPALLLLNQGHQVLFGNDIYNYLKPNETDYTNASVSRNSMEEPSAYAIGGGGNNISNVNSDNFSFLDQSSDALSAKGNGGLRQMYNYATLNHNDKIETPPDTYEPDKVGNISMEKLQQQRNNDIPKTQTNNVL